MHPTQPPPKPYQLLDKPITNPKYGGITLLGAVHKILYQPNASSFLIKFPVVVI